jgi:hypothetical protein
VTNRALFDVNADGLNQGFNGSSGQALTFTLRSPSNIRSWVLQTYDAATYDPNLGVFANPPRSSSEAPELDLVGSTTGQAVAAATPSSTITTALPSTASAHSYIIRSVVDGGVDDKGRWDPTKVWERMITVNTVNGVRKIVATERTQYSDASWEEPFNKALELFRTTLVDQQVVQASTTTALPAYTRTGNNYQANANGAITSASTDGVTPVVGMRILHRHAPGAGADNGVIVLTSLGSAGTPWTATRATDFDVSGEFVTGKIIPVATGATLQGTRWIMSVGSPFVLNTDAVTFFQYQASGVYDVKQFGAIGNGVANDTAPIASAKAAAEVVGGGVVYFPRGSYLTDNISVSNASVIFRGDGEDLSIIIPRQVGTRIAFTTCTGAGIEGLAINATTLSGFGGGYAVVFTSCVRPRVRRCAFRYVSGGVTFDRCSDYSVDDFTVERFIGGGAQSAVRTVGTPAVPCVRGKVNRLKFRNQYTRSEGLDLVPKTWTISTAYSVGDVVFIGANDGVFECVAAGTSAGAGTGPTQPTGVAGEAYFTTDIVDGAGTLRWRIVCNNSWVIVPDSDTARLEITNCDIHGGRVGFIPQNTVGGGTIPVDVEVHGLRTFRTHLKGVSLDRGVRFKFHDCYFDYAVADHGVSITTTFTGDVWFHDSWSRRNWFAGFSFFGAGPVEQHIRNCHFHDNSRAGSANSAGLEVNNNTGLFSIQGCTARGSLQSYGILIGTGVDNYTIVGNTLKNNVTGGLLDNSIATAGSRIVRNNLGVSRTVGIPLKAFSGIGTIFTEETNATIPHILQTAVTGPGDLRFLVPAGLIPVGAKITKVWAIWGNQGNTTLPVGTMPRVQFHRRLNTIGSAFINGVGNGTETQIGTFTDNTAVVATYKLLHEIAITGLSEIVVADAEYSIHFRGEDGANEVAGGTLVGLRVTYEGD